jgi:hypothetical protein
LETIERFFGEEGRKKATEEQENNNAKLELEQIVEIWQMQQKSNK